MSQTESYQQRPLVSIYTITYNHEKYIRDCLDGIVSQVTDFPFEAIVIDDASTDSTAAIIREYQERYPDIIRPVLHTENQWSKGGNHLFDTFLPMARGEFWACCEGDDFWSYPGKLQQQVDFLRAHPDVTACFHLHNIKDETELCTPQPKLPFRRSRPCNVTDIIFDSKIQLATLVSRLDKYRNHPELYDILQDFHRNNVFGDTCLYAFELASGTVYGMTPRWSTYRIHHSGVSYSFRSADDWHELKMRGMRLILKHWPERFPSLPEKYEAHFKIRQRLTKWTCARRDGRYFDAITQFVKAFFISPRQFMRIYINTYI